MAEDREPEHQVPAASRRRALLWGLLKILWMLTVFAVSTWYIVTRWGEIGAYFSELGIAVFSISLLAVTGGRVVLARVSQLALQLFGTRIGLGLSFWINAMSQLGKYLPGSVWQFVGRVALYRRHGVPVARGSGVLLVENAILFASGACLGLTVGVGALLSFVGYEEGLTLGRQVAGSALGIVIWWLMIAFGANPVLRRFSIQGELPRTRTTWTGIAFWLAFGLAFWVLLPADARTLSLFPAATGAFALAWIAGNLTPLAPAGIGVREAVIVALIGPIVSVPVAVGAAASSRIVWTVGEFLTAPVAAGQLSRHQRVRTVEETS